MIEEPEFGGTEVAVALLISPRELATLRGSGGKKAIRATNRKNARAQRWSLLDAAKLKVIQQFALLTSPAERRALWDFLSGDDGRLALEGALTRRPWYLLASTRWKGYGSDGPTPGFGRLKLEFVQTGLPPEILTNVEEAHLLGLHVFLPKFKRALEARRTYGLSEE